MFGSVQPHRRQPTKLPAGIFQAGTLEWVTISLSGIKVKSESEVAQCPTPSDPMDCSLPGSSIHGIFQARVLEWVAIAFSSLTVLDEAISMFTIKQVCGILQVKC